MMNVDSEARQRSHTECARTTISVVTAAFNPAEHLETCLKSILQEVKAFRAWRARSLPQGSSSPNEISPITLHHLVVDAASTDGTLELLAQWEKDFGALSTTPRESSSGSIEYQFSFLSEPDAGQSDGLNKGFRLAQGDWILWLNADDYLLPGALQAFVEVVEHGPEAVDVVYGHYQFVNAEGAFQRHIYTIPYSQFLVRHLAFLPPTSGTLFRRQILVENPLDLDFHYTMDREWFLRCGHSLRTKRIPKELTAFRVMESSKTGKFTLHGEIPDQHRTEQQLNWHRHVEPAFLFLPQLFRWPFYRFLSRICRLVVKVLKMLEVLAYRWS